MFAKHAKVDRDGRFVAAPPKLSKFKYVGMMQIRAMMIAAAGGATARAATIAIRYSCVRRQGFRDSKAEDPAVAMASGENAIIDYQVQQYRLLKVLGLSYLITWTGRAVQDFLRRVVDGVGRGVNDAAVDELPELHATCAGLKAVCTSWAASAVEDARKCCGGQGVLRSSGLADLSTSYVTNVTAEGEQIILGLQTARYLIKAFEQVRAGGGGTLVGSVAYLREPLLPRGSPELGGAWSTDAVVALLRDSAQRAAFDAADAFADARKEGKGFDDALNGAAVLGYHAAECHCLYVLARNARDALHGVTDAAAREALTRLVDLTLLQIVRERGGDFADVLDRAGRRAVVARISALLAQLRPDCVALSDGWGLAAGMGTLGRDDGNVYEAIYDHARSSPLNVPRMVGWDKLAAVMDLDFLRKGMQTQRQGAKL